MMEKQKLLVSDKCAHATDDKIIFEASVLSRKVMLFATNGNDDVQENDLMDGHLCFVLVDYMRSVFPVTQGTVVVPYYPVVHDMVTIKGDDRQIWKACVLSFNLTCLTINARFFVEDMVHNLVYGYLKEVQCRLFTSKVFLEFLKVTGRLHVLVGLMRKNSF